MKKILCLILGAALAAGLCACSASGGTDTAAGAPAQKVVYPQSISYNDYDAKSGLLADNPLADGFTDAVNDFSYETGIKLLTASKNACYSPVSLYFALAVADAGAAGTTKDELDALLCADGFDLSAQCRALYNRMYLDNEVSKLLIANSLWMDDEVNGEKVDFSGDYVKNAADNFYCSLFQADFSSPDTGRRIGQWISDNTNGLLSYEPELSNDEVMAIVNAIYFYDEWQDNFDEAGTKTDVFTLADGSAVSCDFMNRIDSESGFYKGAGYTRASLSLKGNGAMTFVLPDVGTDLSALLTDKAALNEAFTGGAYKSGKVVWSIPKFSYDSSFEPIEALKALGVSDAFDPDAADFSGISNTPLYVSYIRQDTHIGVNEKGVEAAAYTVVEMMAGSAMQDSPDTADMVLNRPFLYGITSSDGALVFVGVCCNPAV